MMIGRRFSVLFVLIALAMTAATPAGAPDPVLDAARKGDLKALKALIAKGADVNNALGDGMTALHFAAERNDADAVALLIKAGARLDAGTRIGHHTPLHVAAKAGSAAVVRVLLTSGSGAMVNGRTSNTGSTPLHLAAQGGNAEVVTLLVEHGADVEAEESEWGQTPLIFAAAWNRDDVIRVLLKHGANPEHATKMMDVIERTRLEGAARGKAQDVQKEVLGAQGRPSGKITQEERLKVEAAAREVLRAGVIPPPVKDTAVQEFDHIADYNAQVGTMGGLTPLLHAVREGYVEATLALLDGGASLESAADGTTPLVMATINGHFDLAMTLLGRGANPKAANSAGVTALYAAVDRVWAPKTFIAQIWDHEAQESSHYELMKALLDAGANPNVRLEKNPYYYIYFACMNANCGLEMMWGATPFNRAAFALDLEAMKLLHSYGADPTIPLRQAPTYRARYWETGQGMGALSRVVPIPNDPSGLPPVPVGGPGTSPIHAATGAGYGNGFVANAHRYQLGGWLPAVKYLVEELHVDVNARDETGYTPLHNAAARGDNAMIMYLIDHGADVTLIARTGQSVADMANGPWERISPFPETVALLEKLGSKNNHQCVSC